MLVDKNRAPNHCEFNPAASQLNLDQHPVEAGDEVMESAKADAANKAVPFPGRRSDIATPGKDIKRGHHVDGPKAFGLAYRRTAFANSAIASKRSVASTSRVRAQHIKIIPRWFVQD